MEEFVLLIMLLCPLSIVSSAEANPVKGFSVDLIHRDSPLSPFYNSSMTKTEAIINAAMRSIAQINNRFFFLNNKADETVLIPNGPNYLMKIFIGTPPIESLAVADTGSDLVWVQCLPCEQCYRQNAPIFDPKKSSTFEVISCDSQSCNLLPNRICGSSKQCRYYYSYGDQSKTAGELASDIISFGASNSNGTGQSPLLASNSKTILGCGHNNNGKFTSTMTGLVGLGGGPLSLVSQLGDEIGHKFSYCLLPSSSKATSKLKFGDESTISGNGVVSTPLVSKSPSTYYYLTLEGVSIGKKKLQTEQSEGNIIIDSGTTLTLLESNFYNSLEAAVKEAIGDDHEPVQDPPEPFKLCYNRDKSIENKVPDMIFHFSGADVVLKSINTFLFGDDILCLSMVPDNRLGLSIFGNIAQINFKVQYDLQGKKVSFAPADCTME